VLIFLSILQFAFIIAIVVYLMINTWFLEKVEPATGPLPACPFVSVCVPARNEERDIEV